ATRRTGKRERERAQHNRTALATRTDDATMNGRGPMPCRFGVDCHRKDCWYAHPAGRSIDSGGGGGGGGGSSSYGAMPNGSNGASGTPGGAIGGGGGGGGARPGMVPGGMMPHASPRPAGGGGRGGRGGGGGGGGGNNECRYGFQCKREDCHFSHPFGRAIDGDGGGGGGVGGGGGGGGRRPALNRGTSNNSVGSVTRGMSELSFGSYPPANATDDEQDLRDTWFPKARDCTCCKGFVYGCTADICDSMGQCTCSIEEADLDGSSDVASNVSRTNSPHLGMASNGSPMGPGEGWTQPPQPPTEAALAAAAAAAAAPPAPAGGGGGRPSAGRGAGGGPECRYGTGCKRANCSFGHPRGRKMDSDGVTFGDFGGGGSSGGGGVGDGGGGGGGGRGPGARSTAQQDLMDTWYPDCRECSCCK
ncbi:unnamed protein product, partial [Ectocarpus sp. 13 AM-2016]